MKVATLVLIVKGNELLLGEKKMEEIGEGLLCGPGGKLLPGETPIECAIRETSEELALTVYAPYLCNKEVARIQYFAAGAPSFFVHHFVTSVFDGKLVETPVFERPEWYDINALPFLRMFESDRFTFPRLLEAYRFPEEKFDAKVRYRQKAKELTHIEFLPFGSLELTTP
jgi:8-oxo-dGTP diphosphatase